MQLFVATNEMEIDNHCFTPAKELGKSINLRVCSVVLWYDRRIRNVGSPGSNPTGVGQPRGFFLQIAGKFCHLIASCFLRIAFLK